ncbi:hypothetical protein [Streptomyces sp. ME19-01-6]|uniref:hypothetical protein n=1 Tax=Streptomyces sp. ME19-01-6 TaxID=3028686 RepID=UPI0029B8D7FA|nr:hypothetical protein [Streptomyces sp. ME19-01-6]MDX3224484.1 hypothetical protein [Streptomyces sp. ME19-01-6]
MSTTPDRLSEIARSLNRLQWLPTAEETELGNAFFRHLKTIEEEPQPDFPRGLKQSDRLHTEHLAVLARSVEKVRDELLPAWKYRLDGSPMIELVEHYVRGAQPLLPHAERLLANWRDAILPALTADEIAYEAKRLNISPEEGEANLRYWQAAHWEEEHAPRALWDELQPAWSYLWAVESTMTAALTGDTEY